MVVILPAVLLVVGVVVYKFYQGRKVLGWAPGMTVLFAPLSLIGPLLPEFPLNPGLSWHWTRRNRVYQEYDSETISVVPVVFGRSFLYTSSREVANQILASKAPFKKSPEMVTAVSHFGENLFTANGMEWRRHRRIVGPAFRDETYELVWKETSAIYHEMITNEKWDLQTSVTVPVINELTLKVALMVLARCAFGKRMPWKPAEDDPFDVLEFAEAFVTISETFIERLVLPRWAYKLPIRHFHKIEAAYETLTRHMLGLIEARRSGEDVEDRFDVFSLLCQASEAEGKLALSPAELMGNTFFVLWAGHETMSSILNATIGLLAIHPEIQEEMYREVMNVAPRESLPYAASEKLNKILSCFLEAGRLFPAGYLVIRETTEPISLENYDENGKRGSYVLEQGANVAIDLIGLHYNPRHFPDPEAYEPSRWYNIPESELSIFSLGPRACIGRKFAMTEACCFLAHLIRDWKFEPILTKEESTTQWRSRVLNARVSMTVGVGPVPIKFIRREILE